MNYDEKKAALAGLIERHGRERVSACAVAVGFSTYRLAESINSPETLPGWLARLYQEHLPGEL